MKTIVASITLLLIATRAFGASAPDIPTETSTEAKLRHERVAERRKGINILCHRGASEHAHENTLEAYRATFELGGDGNEIDIRKTKDGVLVCFHDDMLDRLLEAYGDVSDFTWAELQQFRFREPGRFGDQCRIPTLVEVFELHRKHAGLMHLDIKRPDLDVAISDLLTRMDMWDHVAYSNMENGGVILKDPQLKLRRYKAGLFENRSEVFPVQIAAALKQLGNDVIADDPRGVAVALGRKLGKLSTQPVTPKPIPSRSAGNLPSEAELIAILSDADDWNRIAETPADQADSAERIISRANAAEWLLEIKASSQAAFVALDERVRNRSLHKDWMYHGVDGAIALRSLILRRAPQALETARFVVWRDDPDLEPLANKLRNSPRALVDFRAKFLVFPTLKKIATPGADELCRDYLALSDEEARRIGLSQFQEAAAALLAIRPQTDTALELLRHRLQVVRGRTILECVAHADEQWARAALEQGAPHALAYRVEYAAAKNTSAQ